MKRVGEELDGTKRRRSEAGFSIVGATPGSPSSQSSASLLQAAHNQSHDDLMAQQPNNKPLPTSSALPPINNQHQHYHSNHNHADMLSNSLRILLGRLGSPEFYDTCHNMIQTAVSRQSTLSETQPELLCIFALWIGKCSGLLDTHQNSMPTPLQIGHTATKLFELFSLFPALLEGPDGSGKVLTTALLKLSNFADALSGLYQKSESVRDNITQLIEDLKSVTECYAILNGVMEYLFVACSDNPSLTQTVKDIHRYIWLVFLYTRGVYLVQGLSLTIPLSSLLLLDTI
jgi:hypothetical protein